MTSGSKITWIPLESNPAAFNKYIDKLGVKGVECHEMLGFDAEMAAFVPGPHLALVFCYPYQESANAYLKGLYDGLPAEVPDWAFFMKQKIRNACGTFALFHALTNNGHRSDFGNGPFADWYAKALKMGVEERSDLLANSPEMAQLHEHCASNDSETRVPDNVEYHFISYLCHDGRLYEFDSGQQFPRDCGPTSDATLLFDAGKECQKLLAYAKNPNLCNAIAVSEKGEAVNSRD